MGDVATSLESLCSGTVASLACRGTRSPTCSKFSCIASMLSQIGPNVVAGNGVGETMSTCTRVCDFKGTKARFTILSINWGAMELREAGFNV